MDPDISSSLEEISYSWTLDDIEKANLILDLRDIEVVRQQEEMKRMQDANN